MRVNFIVLAIFLCQTNAIRFVSESDNDDDEAPVVQSKSQSTVSLLKNLVNVAPALGNI